MTGGKYGKGGVCGGGHAWQRDMCGRMGACLAGGGACMARRVCVVGACKAGGGACMARGACVARRACVVGETATALDGTHLTGMHSCFPIKIQNTLLEQWTFQSAMASNKFRLQSYLRQCQTTCSVKRRTIESTQGARILRLI